MRLCRRQSAFRRYRRPEAAVCPECAYPIQARGSPRCSECGTPYPGPWNTRLRWGRRRLPVERRRLHRRFLPIAWLQTFMYATFGPVCAARRLGVPSRAPRAVCLAVVHSLVAALLLSICSTRSVTLAEEYRSALNARIADGAPLREALFSAMGAVASDAPHVNSWLLCVGAWGFFFAVALLLGLAAANVVSRRRPAGLAAACRWVFLSTVVFVWIGLASLWISLPAHLDVWLPAAGPPPVPTLGTMPASLPAGIYPRPPPLPVEAGSTWFITERGWRWLGSELAPGLWIVIAVHAVWLTAGFVGNPHRDRKRRHVILITLGTYGAAWILCSQLGAWWAHLLMVL
jgi:hypothetical protein